MIFQALYGFLPFLDAISDSVTNNLHSSTAFDGPPRYSGQQYINGLNNDDNEDAKSTIHVVDDDSDVDALGWHWQLWTIDLLDTSHVHVDLVFPCACHTRTASVVGSRRPPRPRRSRTNSAIFRARSRSSHGSSSSSSPPRLAAAHEEYLTYAMVVATLQVFLHLTRANVTTLFLPILAQPTGSNGGAGAAAQMAGDAVLVVVTTCGVLGSALAARQLGREAMCAISGVLIVLCQVAVPAVVAAHAAGLSRLGGGGHAPAEMFALACAASGGFGWAWGALFWAVVPGDGGGVASVGQAAGAALGFALGFAQMQCFLLTLRQLKHAAFAYYAVWIWS